MEIAQKVTLRRLPMVKPAKFLDRIHFRDSYLATRGAKAEKILKVLRKHKAELSHASLADIGCSRGHITQRLTEEFDFVVGLDLDDEDRHLASEFHFIQADGCSLPLASATFDVVLLNHIVEHVSSPQRLLDEVWRVLKADGVCYLACPNRLSPVEPHYRLPLLSWLPRPLANAYVRLAGRGERYLDNSPTYWGLRKLTRKFHVLDQTRLILKNPDEYLNNDPSLKKQAGWLRWFPEWILRMLVPFFPVWVLILKKEANSSQ